MFKEYSQKIYFQYFLLSILLLMGFVLYSDILKHEFLHWDDYMYVVNHPLVHRITAENVATMFAGFSAQNWHPITWLSFSFDYLIWGGNPRGFHLTSIILHLFNSCLIFFLTKTILEISERNTLKVSQNNTRLWAPLLVTLLFIIHPQHIETVAWISDRKTLLSSLFFVSALIVYMKHSSGGAARYPRNSMAVLYVLAMMSKPVAISLPVVLLAIDIWPLNRVSVNYWLADVVRLVRAKSTLFLLAILFSVMTIMTQQLDGAIKVDQFSFGIRVVNASDSFFFYLGQWVYPDKLSAMHPYSDAALNITVFSLFSSGLILMIVVGALLFFKQQIKWPLALLLYYTACLLPVIGLIQVGTQGAADRYTYLSTIGIYVLVGVLFVRYMQKYLTYAPALLILLISIAGNYFYITLKYIPVWRNDTKLWEHVVSVYPDKLSSAYQNLANAHFSNNKYKEAEENYLIALEINDKELLAYLNLSLLYVRNNEYDSAINSLKGGIKNLPGAPSLYSRLADIYYALSEYDSALVLYLEALRLDKASDDLGYRVAGAYQVLGDRSNAIRYLEYTLKLNGDHEQASTLLRKLRKEYIMPAS